MRVHNVPGAKVLADRKRGCVQGLRFSRGTSAVPNLLAYELRRHQQDTTILSWEGLWHGGEGATKLPAKRTVQVWVRVLLPMRGGGS